MTLSRLTLIALGGCLSLSAAKADLMSNLMAYYDFEESGVAGLANKAPGATQYHGTRGGTLHADWGTGSNATGPGFAGDAAFASSGASGVSDRSQLLIGNALNFDDDRNEYVELPIGSAQLGTSFTISAWHALTPGAANPSGRYHVFESSTNYDVSWGTSNTGNTAPQPSYTYLAYIGETPNGGFGSAGVLTGPWHHVAHCVSSDGTTTTLRLYVDGLFAGSRTVATANIDFPALHLGRQRTGADDREWDGMIDEVAIWNRALSETEVKEAFLRGVEGFTLGADLAAGGKAFIGVSSSDPALGEVSGTELYSINDVAQISAIPRPGSVFTGWTGPFAGRGQFFDHTVTASVDSVANFAPDNADDDNDGLTNYEELVVYFTVPDDPDTDDDLIGDGDEVGETGTDPLVSQLAAVNYILENLCTGGVAPGDTVLTRNPANNTLTVRVAAQASATLAAGSWSDLAPEGAVADGVAGEFRLQVPATPDAKRFFQVRGDRP